MTMAYMKHRKRWRLQEVYLHSFPPKTITQQKKQAQQNHVHVLIKECAHYSRFCLNMQPFCVLSETLIFESQCNMLLPWWRHQMETFSVSLVLCAGNSPVTGEFPAQRPVTRSFLMFSLICAWINSWENNREAGDLRRHRVHYDVIVMTLRSKDRKLNLIILRCTTNMLLLDFNADAWTGNEIPNHVPWK